MSDLLAGENFLPGEDVDAPRLMNAFNSAAIQSAFLTGKTIITPAGADSILFYDLSGTVLGKCTLTELITALLGSTSSTAAAGNDTRFPATVTGLRKSAGAGSTDVAAKGPDLAFTPSTATLSAGVQTLDCSLYSLFTISISANAVLTLANIPDGGTVTVRTTQVGGFTLSFTTAQTKKWPAGTPGVISAGAGAIDEWTFTRWGTDLDAQVVKAFA